MGELAPARKAAGWRLDRILFGGPGSGPARDRARKFDEVLQAAQDSHEGFVKNLRGAGVVDFSIQALHGALSDVGNCFYWLALPNWLRRRQCASLSGTQWASLWNATDVAEARGAREIFRYRRATLPAAPRRAAPGIFDPFQDLEIVEPIVDPNEPSPHEANFRFKEMPDGLSQDPTWITSYAAPFAIRDGIRDPQSKATESAMMHTSQSSRRPRHAPTRAGGLDGHPSPAELGAQTFLEANAVSERSDSPQINDALTPTPGSHFYAIHLDRAERGHWEKLVLEASLTNQPDQPGGQDPIKHAAAHPPRAPHKGQKFVELSSGEEGAHRAGAPETGEPSEDGFALGFDVPFEDIQPAAFKTELHRCFQSLGVDEVALSRVSIDIYEDDGAIIAHTHGHPDSIRMLKAVKLSTIEVVKSGSQMVLSVYQTSARTPRRSSCWRHAAGAAGPPAVDHRQLSAAPAAAAARRQLRRQNQFGVLGFVQFTGPVAYLMGTGGMGVCKAFAG
ncbi:unnamed protein product [Prorocentrum cordatum]|uniref:Uncharacterized protein n=1 Tax=Prorocentrum cordatum TaxID=2364126 RepID=A0ABN9T920_9DINO|nr:unnamed protein product [Polarella glacialis]